MPNGRRAHISTLFAAPQGCLEVNHQFKRFLDLNNFKEECCVLNNDNIWMYLFLMCHIFYAPMRVLRLADQKTVSMDKLYFYVLQTDRMLMKGLPDCEKKSTELLRDTSLSQVMTNCGADIDCGSNKEEEIVDDEDNDDEGRRTMIRPLREMTTTRTLKMMIRSLTVVAQHKYHSVHVIVNYYLLFYSSLFLLLPKLP